MTTTYVDTSALVRAGRTGQILDLFEEQTSDDGPISLVGMTSSQVALACDLLEHHLLTALDALHLATALSAQGVLRELLFVTCDERQADVGRQIGLTVQTGPLA